MNRFERSQSPHNKNKIDNERMINIKDVDTFTIPK
jgi:hypothetical protein